jgi:hypothetical protein
MKSSGIKRTMAVFAISAMAVTGIPALAGTAFAIPADEQVEIAQGGPSEVVLFNDYDISTLPDGTDSTVRLEAGGGDNVAQVRFQYSINGGNWANIATATRNDDGNFSTEWAVPAFLLTETIELRVQDFTGGVQGDNDGTGFFLYVGDDEESVNLTAGTAKGYFEDCAGDEIVGLTGTTSETDPNGDINTYYHVGDTTYDGSSNTTIEGGATATAATGTFNSVLNITGYPFTPVDPTPPQDPDHLTVGAEVWDSVNNAWTQDLETYTLREQTIGSVTAVDNGTSTAPDDADITVTVLDQDGQPIAGAVVRDSLDVFVGTTDGRGEVDTTLAQNSTVEYYYADNPDTALGCDSDFSPAQGDKRSPTLAVTSPSAIVITSNPAGTVAVGSSVTETITVKDGAGNALVNETVRITRTGPGTNDEVVFRTTNAQGQVTYTFTCTQAGTAKVNAAIEDPNSPLNPNDTYNRSVNDTVQCGNAPVNPPTDARKRINPAIKGKNVNGGDDRITVRAKQADGAAVKLYKIVGQNRRVLVDSGRLNGNGVFRTTIKDSNGVDITAYKAVVSATADTLRGVTQRRQLNKIG